LSFGGILPKILLVKTDCYGNIQWMRKSRWLTGVGFSVQQTNDGGYIIGGHTGTHHHARNILLIKTDMDGFPLHKC